MNTMKTFKGLVLAVVAALGLSAWAEPDAVQLWKDGPYWATSNVGTPETHDPAYPAEYGALYTFAEAGTAVKSLLGEEWRLPSKDDFDKLVDGSYCTRKWDSTKNGYTFTGATDGYKDKSIFLPAAGYDVSGDRKYAGGEGDYWSSTGMGDYGAYDLYFTSGGTPGVRSSSRRNGVSIRAVRDAK